MLPRSRMQKILRATLLAILVCLMTLFSERQVTIGQPLARELDAGSTIPTIVSEVEGQEVVVPDFSQLTIRALGAIEEAGSIPSLVEIDLSELTSSQVDDLRSTSFLNSENLLNLDLALGYAFGRDWTAGTALAEVLRIGDLIGGDLANGLDTVENIWTVGSQTLESIGEIAGAAENILGMEIPEIEFLRDLEVVEFVGGLREQLADGLIDSDLVANIEEQLQDVLDSETFQDIENALGDAGEVLGAVGTLGSLTDGVTLSEVNELAELALEHFPGIRDFAVDAIPFLEDVPFNQIAAVAENLNFIVRIDTLYGSPEGFTRMTQSGGFNPPPCTPPSMPQQDCDVNNGDSSCPHIETFNLLSLIGADIPGVGFIADPFFGRWVSGQAQEVEGGCGPLKAFNGGKEPTGLHPFGSIFKFAIWDIEDTTDTVTTRIFFRICISIPFIGRTCTPYAIPPQGIPFVPFSRDSFIPASGISL